MAGDVLHLMRPAPLIHAEGLRATMGRYLVEARLDDAEQGAGRSLFQGELDKCRRFAGIIDRRIDGIGMPGEGEEAHRLDLLDHRLQPNVLVAWFRDLAARYLAGDERPLQPHPEPAAEFAIIRQRTPDSGNRR